MAKAPRGERHRNRAYKATKPREAPESLSEWLKRPDTIARRGEVWEVAIRAAKLVELERRRNRWDRRVRRWLKRRFRPVPGARAPSAVVKPDE